MYVCLLGKSASPIELQFTLAPYDILKDGLTDYAGLVVQYGFTVLFVAAFPLAPTLALISGQF